jgi:hypothetical protein
LIAGISFSGPPMFGAGAVVLGACVGPGVCGAVDGAALGGGASCAVA